MHALHAMMAITTRVYCRPLGGVSVSAPHPGETRWIILRRLMRALFHMAVGERPFLVAMRSLTANGALISKPSDLL